MILFTSILLTLLLFYLIRDIKKLLKINSIITITSGYIIIIINAFMIILLKKKLYFISIIKITNIISKNGTNRGLKLILLGAIQLIAYTIIKTIDTYKKKN